MIDILSAAWPYSGIRAFTTRNGGGLSAGPYGSLNLATHVDDRVQDVMANRARLKEAQRLPNNPCWLRQVHSATVVDAAHPYPEPPTADGSFTISPGVVCAVLTADCLPIVLADRSARVVAVLHGGWRGLVGGIIEAGIRALPTPPRTLVAWLGPAIGPAHYEVGPEVRAAFDKEAHMAFVALRTGKYRADLYALARWRLRAAGITEIYGGGLDTFHDESLYSFRREPVCGRMATVAWIV